MSDQNTQKSGEGAVQGQNSVQKQFRGAVIHIAEDGKYGVELKDVMPMELYGVLSLLYKRMSKDFGGE